MLDRLVATQKENNARLAAIEKSVNALVSINKKTEAREKLEAKRARSAARTAQQKREKAPAAAIKKQNKEEKKGLFSGLIDALKAPVAIAAGVGLLVAVLKDEKVQKQIGKAFETLTPIFLDIAKKMGEILLNVGKQIALGLWRGVAGDYSNPAAAAALADPKTTEQEAKDIKKLTEAINAKKHKEKEYYRWKFDAKKKEERGDKIGAKRSREFAAAEREKVQAQIAEIQALKELAIAKGIATESDFRMRSAQEAYKGMGWWEKFTNEGTFSPEGLQKGGRVRVPGSGSGDKVPAVVAPGSFVMNRNATKVMGYQTGGVPVMLEPGEQVFGPGSWGPVEMMMNSIIPRFQNGGVIPTSSASGARDGVTPSQVASGTTPKDIAAEAEANKETTGKSGSDAIIKAAEAAAKRRIYKGVGEMCAVTTRAVLGAANHPAAEKLTTTADLDSPQGYGPSKENRALAGSFAGTDMGAVHTPSSAPPGSVLLWRGTYGQWKGTDAITHVGLKGKGSTMYHHGSGPGWRKDSMGNYMPDLAIDLNGEAKGGSENISSPSRAAEAAGLAGPLVDNPITDAAGNALNFAGAASQEAIRKAGLPGLADAMHVLGEGFRQSKAYTVLPSILGGMAELGRSLMGSIFGGLMGQPVSAAEKPKGTMGPGPTVPSDRLNIPTTAEPETPGTTPSAPAISPKGSAAPAGSGAFSNTFKGFYDMAKKAGAKYPQLVAAQWQLESAHGKILSGTHNYFGVKAGKGEDGTMKPTWEVINGKEVHITDKFKNFSSAQDSVNELVNKWHKDYGSYRGVNNAPDAYSAADMLRQQGYATDPAYSRKLKRIMKENGYQTGGIVNMSSASTPNMQRYEQAMETFKSAVASGSQPIIVPVPMPSKGGGGGGVTVAGGMGTPPPPDLPSGPQVVALLELQNRLALGAAL